MLLYHGVFQVLVVRPECERATRFQLGASELQGGDHCEHFLIVDVVLDLRLIQLLREEGDWSVDSVPFLDERAT